MHWSWCNPCLSLSWSLSLLLRKLNESSSVSCWLASDPRNHKEPGIKVSLHICPYPMPHLSILLVRHGDNRRVSDAGVWEEPYLQDAEGYLVHAELYDVMCLLLLVGISLLKAQVACCQLGGLHTQVGPATADLVCLSNHLGINV